MRHYGFEPKPDMLSRRDPNFEVTFDSRGIAVSESRSRETKRVRITWTEVMRVTAFKRDIFTFDRICLAFSGSDGNDIELDEEISER